MLACTLMNNASCYTQADTIYIHLHVLLHITHLHTYYKFFASTQMIWMHAYAQTHTHSLTHTHTHIRAFTKIPMHIVFQAQKSNTSRELCLKASWQISHECRWGALMMCHRAALLKTCCNVLCLSTPIYCSRPQQAFVYRISWAGLKQVLKGKNLV